MHLFDWLVIVAYFAWILYGGLRKARNTQEIEGYFLANRSLPWWAVGLSVMGAVMVRRLASGLSMAEALHGVFVVGLAVSVLALASAFLVPAGRARELARPDMREEPTRAGG